jgi:hypothetical protein
LGYREEFVLQEGYLLISDISGYTAFLTQSELEHAHAVLEELFEALMTNIRLPLKIAKLEGDAIFAYARKGSYIEGLALLEGVEHLYNTFADARTTMVINTTCTCTACKLIPTLDLKFFVHHGEFIVDKSGELSGASVILIHRLMKNTVVEDTGIKAYALFTQDAIKMMDAGEAASGMRAHVETYEHLGDVPCLIHDLTPVYQAYKERARVMVAEDDVWLYMSCDVPIPAPVAWSYINTPEGKTRVGYGDVAVMDKLARRGVGTTHHCAHGKQVIVQKYVDYRPFEYMTHESHFDFGLWVLVTNKLTPTEGGTRIEWYTSKIRGQKLLAKIAMTALRKQFNEQWGQVAKKMGELVQEDVKSGRIEAISKSAEPVPA